MFSDRHARHTPPTRPMDPVIIIGAGWAGLSAALHLRQAGVPVRVLEAAPQAGGRARRQVLPWPDTDGIALDNGQHLLLGAYRDTLDLVAWLDGQGMDRLPLRIENCGRPAAASPPPCSGGRHPRFAEPSAGRIAVAAGSGANGPRLSPG